MGIGGSVVSVVSVVRVVFVLFLHIPPPLVRKPFFLRLAGVSSETKSGSEARAKVGAKSGSETDLKTKKRNRI